MSKTTWRGAQVAPNITIENVLALNTHPANIIRYQYDFSNFDYYAATLTNLLNNTTSKVLISAYVSSGQNPVTDLEYRKEFIDLWKVLDRKYYSDDKVIAQGILNEPQGTVAQVKSLMLEAYAALWRNKRIAVTCPYSDPMKMGKTVFIPKDDYVWYEVHMYLPFVVSHQGVYPQYPYPVEYPNSKVNKAKLKTYLAATRAFQQLHHARILVGEFSISCFASPQSRKNYLTDCIDIFEEYGWNWIYHAWREAYYWDVEPVPLVADTLYNAWGKNE